MKSPIAQWTKEQAQTEEFAGEFAGHRFLMTSVRTGNTEIFLVDPYSASAANLTRNPASHNRYPAWSPDGGRIAFTSDRDGAYNLFVMDADGENVRQLTWEALPRVVYFPSWSGDGKRIIYGLAGCEPPLICEVALDGGSPTVIVEGRDPHVAQNGNPIAFTKLMDSGYAVFVLETATGQVRQLTSHPNEIGAVTPTFSPDGEMIAYSDTVGGKLELFAVSVSTGAIRQLTHLGQFATCAAWSPDGKWISFRLTDEAFWIDPARMKLAYSERLPEKRPVWVMGSDGAHPHCIEALRCQCGIDGSRAAWDPKGGTK